MKMSVDLYNNIPPSLKSHQDNFISSDVNEFCRKIADFALALFIKKHFFAVHVKNSFYFNLRDANCPNIIYASHNSWWDGLIGYFLCRRVFKTDIRIMVEDLQACPLLSKVGAFSIDKKSTSSVLKSLNYAVKELESQNRSLYIFPQGIIKPPDFKPIEFGSGISYIAKKIRGVNFIPITYRYCFLRNSFPEVLVEVQKPFKVDEVYDIKELTSFLESKLDLAVEKQKTEISAGKFHNYVTVVKRSHSIMEMIEKKLKK